jgi:hypothetical protein
MPESCIVSASGNFSLRLPPRVREPVTSGSVDENSQIGRSEGYISYRRVDRDYVDVLINFPPEEST